MLPMMITVSRRDAEHLAEVIACALNSDLPFRLNFNGETDFRFQAHRSPRRKYLIELRQGLIKRFSDGELRTICGDLGIDYDNLPGEEKASKARELVGYLERRDQIPQLVEIVRERRPHAPWEYTSEATRQAPSISLPLEQLLIVVSFVVLTEKIESTKPGEVSAPILVAYPANLHAIQPPPTSPGLSRLIVLGAVLTVIVALTILAVVAIVAQ